MQPSVIFFGCFFIFVFINGTFELSGHLLGYHQKYGINLPRTEFSSCGMTLSKCVDICGLMDASFLAAIKGEHCICGSHPPSVENLYEDCKQMLPCPGNSSEFCGCHGRYAYYKTEFIGQCSVTITIGNEAGKSSLYATNSVVTIQVSGDAGECFEGSFGGNALHAGKSATFPSACRELGRIQRLRYGLENPKDALFLVESIISVPLKTPHNYTLKFVYNNWLGKETYDGKTYGEGYSVVDLFPNGTYTFPEKVGGLFYKPYSKPSQRVTICSLNSDCKTGNTFVQFEGLFYKKQVYLPNLYSLKRTGCLSPRLIPADVTTNMPAYIAGQQFSTNSVYTFTCNKGGIFLKTNTSTFNSTCNAFGAWSTPLKLECQRDCLERAPLPDDGMTSNGFSEPPSSPGEEVTYSCGEGAVFKGTLANSVSVKCLNSGQWSVQKLPPCVNPPPNRVRCMQTSSIRPFKQLN